MIDGRNLFDQKVKNNYDNIRKIVIGQDDATTDIRLSQF